MPERGVVFAAPNATLQQPSQASPSRTRNQKSETAQTREDQEADLDRILQQFEKDRQQFNRHMKNNFKPRKGRSGLASLGVMSPSASLNIVNDGRNLRV